MNTKPYNRYSFEKLLSAATASGAEQIDIDTLGAWCEDYGESLWNGEYYDVSGDGEPSGSRRLFRVIAWDAETEQGETVGYNLD